MEVAWKWPIGVIEFGGVLPGGYRVAGDEDVTVPRSGGNTGDNPWSLGGMPVGRTSNPRRDGPRCGGMGSHITVPAERRGKGWATWSVKEGVFSHWTIRGRTTIFQGYYGHESRPCHLWFRPEKQRPRVLSTPEVSPACEIVGSLLRHSSSSDTRCARCCGAVF